MRSDGVTACKQDALRSNFTSHGFDDHKFVIRTEFNDSSKAATENDRDAEFHLQAATSLYPFFNFLLEMGKVLHYDL